MSEEKQPLSPAPEQESKPEPEKKPEHSHKHRQKSVFQYITILFAAAFVLLLMSFLMQQRANQAALDDLQQTSDSTVQSLENGQYVERTVQITLGTKPAGETN